MKNNQHWHSNPTQIYWVCSNLIAGRTLTHKTEIREVKGWRLAAIIHKLKRQYNWPIEGEARGKDSIQHYWLDPSANPTALDLPPSARSLKDAMKGTTS